MTRADKFAIARALFHAQVQEPVPPPAVRLAFTQAVNAVAEVVCPTAEENHTFRKLVLERSNWIAQDNPFRDDHLSNVWL